MSDTYTNEEFKEAVKTSFSIAQVLQKLNKIPSGGNYKVVKFKIKQLNLDSSHFTGKGHLKNKTHNWAPKLDDNLIFVENCKHNLSTVRIKQRLLVSGKLEKKCYNCENTKWLSEEIPLELEHKNGDNKDNRIENLTLLCPNCHALTPTYRGRNKNKVL
jgi:hypothetical protein